MKNEEIYKLLEDQGEKFDLKLESLNKTVRYGLKGIRVYTDAGFEANDKADKMRNNRIEKVEVKTDKLCTWKTKTVTRNKVVWIGLSGIATFLGTIIATNWNKLFE